MKYFDFESHIENVKKGQEQLAPIYLLTGDDSYLIKNITNTFKDFLNKDFFDFNFFKCSLDDGLTIAVENLCTYPVFDDKKIVLVQDISGALTEVDESVLLKYAEAPSEGSTLVLIGDKDFSKKYLKKLKAQEIDCSGLSENEAYIEMDKLLNNPPIAIMERSTKSELYSRTLGSMARIASEIVKLKDYAGTTITIKDIEDMVAPDFDFQIYEISNAVSEKNASKALEILDSFNKNGVRGVTIINLLYGHYRKMLHAELHKNQPDDVVAELMGVKPQALYHIRRVSKNYTQLRLKKCVDYLHDLQYRILQGNLTEGNASKDAIITLLSI